MMIGKTALSLGGSLLFSITFTVQAHDSHTHEAPWQACETKQVASQCSYTNGAGDLYKGTCQTFQEALMCVRNKPIEYAKPKVKLSTDVLSDKHEEHKGETLESKKEQEVKDNSLANALLKH